MRVFLTFVISVFCFSQGALAQGPSREEVAAELIRLMESMRTPPKDKDKCSRLTRQSVERIYDSRFDVLTTRVESFVMIREGCFDPFSSFVHKSSSRSSWSAGSNPTPTSKDTSLPHVEVAIASLAPSVKAEVPDKVAYIAIGTFFTDASVLVRTVLERHIKEKGEEPKFIVMDLRDNPGGNLREAKKLLELFSPQAGEIAYTIVPRVGAATVRKMSGRGPFAHIPMAVLMNDDTGSAAETVAGVLKLWNKVLVGRKTYGKGVYQIPYTIGLVEVLLTEGEVVLGRDRISYHGKGIEPDHGMEVKDAKITYNASDKVYLKAIEGLYFP